MWLLVPRLECLNLNTGPEETDHLNKDYQEYMLAKNNNNNKKKQIKTHAKTTIFYVPAQKLECTRAD